MQDGASVQYSQEVPGPYDIWAISYGYTPMRTPCPHFWSNRPILRWLSAMTPTTCVRRAATPIRA
jgi:hypothetical protein